MQDVIMFIFGLIAAATALMGLFVIFNAIRSEDDEKIARAFQQGVDAGMRAKMGKQPKSYVDKNTLTKALRR